MRGLDDLVAEIYHIVPALPAALREEGKAATPDPDLPILWLGDLGTALATLLPSLEDEAGTQAFAVIEHHLSHGSEELATGIATGLLEALAVAVSERTLLRRSLTRVLGARSRASLESWYVSTYGHAPFSDEDSMPGLDEFVRALYDAVPTLPDALRADGREVEPDEEIPSIWLGDVGQTLARVLPSLEPTQASHAFALIEQGMLRPPDDRLKTAIATELLEALASAVSGRTLPGRTLASVLGPESRAYIDAWDQFTLGRSSLE